MLTRQPLRKISVKFLLRREATNAAGAAPVQLFARFHNQVWRYPMGFSVHPNHWDTDAGRLISKAPDAASLNTILVEWEARLKRTFLKLYDEQPGRTITREEFEQALMPEQAAKPAPKEPELADRPYTALLPIWKANQISTDKDSLRRYDQVVRSLNAWKSGLSVRATTEPVAKEYLRYLLSKEMADSNIAKHFQWLRVARKMAGLGEVPWLAYTGKNAPQLDLTAEEVQAIIAVELTEPLLREERDRWLLQLLIGRRQGDMAQLHPGQLETLGMGDGAALRCIRHVQGKTMSDLLVPLCPLAIAIGERWSWQFPKRSEDDRNDWIKQVAFRAGITRRFNDRKISGRRVIDNWQPAYALVSTHTARHTCASLLLEFGPPGEGKALAKAVLGHADEDVTDVYAKEKMRRLAPLILATWAKILPPA